MKYSVDATPVHGVTSRLSTFYQAGKVSGKLRHVPNYTMVHSSDKTM